MSAIAHKPNIIIGIDPAAGPDCAGIVIVRDGVVVDWPRPTGPPELAERQGFDPATLNASIDAVYATRSAEMRDHFRDAETILDISTPCEAFATRPARQVEPLSVVFSMPVDDKSGRGG